MNKTNRTIAKNTGVLMVSQIISWGASLPLVIFMSRYLGAAGVGKIQLANSIWAIVSVIAVFGIDILLAKEIARSPDRTSEFVSISTILRSTLFVIGFVAVALYASLAGYSQETTVILYLIGISWLFTLWGGTTRSALQGLERMEYVSLSDTVSKILLTIICILLLRWGYGIIPIVIMVCTSALINLMIQIVALHHITPLIPYFNGSAAWQMLKSGIPYLASSVFLVVYAQIDMIIISMLLNEEAVGWYAASARLVGTFLFIPTVFITAIFPVLSRMFAHSPESLPRLMSKSFDLLLITGIPIGLGLVAIANPLVVLLFGKDFAPSGPILATRGVVLILTYQAMLLGYFCMSTDKQNAWSILMIVATLATIPLDIILVPLCQRLFGDGAIGGGLSFIVTEGAMVVIGIHLLPKKALGWANAWLAARVVLAGLLMVLSIWWLRDLFIGIPILVGAITYLGLIYLFQVFTIEDRILMKQIVQIVLIRLRLINPRTANLGERNL
jgi:O-antigen/teichoic acid export membrane protein